MNSHIYKALLLHGHDKFDLEILEYCNKKCVLSKEQYYINLFKPEYNILNIAGSSWGFKHSPETLLKFKKRKLSPEALVNLKKSKKDVAPLVLAKMNQLLATGHIITVINKKNNTVKVYNSIRSAAKDMGVSHPTIINYINKDKLLKGIYLIIRNEDIV
jgi:group I intron endonuclease